MPYAPYPSYPYAPATVTVTQTVTAPFPVPTSGASSNDDRVGTVANIWSVTLMAFTLVSGAGMAGRLYVDGLPSNEHIAYFKSVVEGWRTWLNQLRPEAIAHFNQNAPTLLNDMKEVLDQVTRDVDALETDYGRAGVVGRYGYCSEVAQQFRTAHDALVDMDHSLRLSTSPYSTLPNTAFMQQIALPPSFVRPPPRSNRVASLAQRGWTSLRNINMNSPAITRTLAGVVSALWHIFDGAQQGNAP